MEQKYPSSGLLPNISWLPCARGSPFMARAITANAIESRHDDWFFKLASSMIQRGDAAQGKLFARLYCFMLDFIPGGLAGQRFGHLLGGDIMNHILSSTGETAPSRHRLTKDVEAAWQELETWMGPHSTWNDALQAAQTENVLTPAQQKARRRDPSSVKAPGLVSPAGIVALLAIAHPDRLGRFTDRIESLQISWMFERRDILNVRGGFWDGINHVTVETCFRPLSLASADTDMLVDYTRLFGKEFRSLRQDIRPQLPSWASSLALQSPSAVIDEDTQHDGCDRPDEMHQPERRTSNPAISDLRRLFTPAEMTSTFEQLLRERLTGDVVMQHWERCWREVLRGPNPAIWQSLFRQSARLLANFLALGNSNFAPPEAYMILDLYDTGLGPSERGDFRRVLDRLEEFGACRKALNDLCQAVKWDSEALTDGLTFFAAGLFKNSKLTQFAKSTLQLEELRLRMIIEDLPARMRDTTVFDDELVRRLAITGWQRRQLLVRKPDEVLTTVQLSLLSHRAEQTPVLSIMDGDSSALELLRAEADSTTSVFQPLSPSVATAPESAEEVLSGFFDDLPLPLSEENHADDFFAGLTAPRELKRPGSCDGLRRKKAKLVGIDGDDLAKMLQPSHDALREKLLENIRQDFSQELNSLASEIVSKVRVETQSSLHKVTAEVQSLLTQMAALKSDTEQSMKKLVVLDNALQESHKTAQRILEISALKGSTVPAPGDPDFLAHNCPAPPGWSQKGYEAMTYRASGFYVSYLGNPSAGFYGDEEAFKATSAEFSELPQKHLVAALRHYHSLLYDRPFSRKPTEG